MQANRIKHITALITPNKEHKRKRTELHQIAHVLSLMMDPKSQPLLIHCNKGKVSSYPFFFSSQTFVHVNHHHPCLPHVPR